MMNAKEDTYYDIYILHAGNVDLKKEDLNKIPLHYKNCRINYISVGGEFDDAFEIRHVTKATYYRLLIPDLIPDYDKVIYADVDIIFRMDLSEVYNKDYSDYYIAAALDMGLSQDQKHLDSIGVERWKYLQAGFAILNLKKMREDNMVSVFKDLAKNNYTYQDQDILNISCKGKIKFLPPCYNVNDCALIYIYWHPEVLPDMFTKEDYEYARKNGIKLTEILPRYELYGRAAPIIRNRKIVESADKIIIFWNGSSKGTLSVISYAEKLKKEYELIICK
jgi:lipopolysaccharide biosynthesis glycosyltransferase